MNALTNNKDKTNKWNLFFKQWPQEALISVSMRFQNEMEVLTNDIKPSIAQFMAYVHGSVNEMSKVSYLLQKYRVCQRLWSFMDFILIHCLFSIKDKLSNLPEKNIDRVGLNLWFLFLFCINAWISMARIYKGHNLRQPQLFHVEM